MRIAPQVLVQLIVQTTLTVHLNSWVWAHAMMARKSIHGFDAYPYVDPPSNISGMSLRACDLPMDVVHAMIMDSAVISSALILLMTMVARGCSASLVRQDWTIGIINSTCPQAPEYYSG